MNNKHFIIRIAKSLNIDNLRLSKEDKLIAKFIVFQTNKFEEFYFYNSRMINLFDNTKEELTNILSVLVKNKIIIVEDESIEKGILKLTMVNSFSKLIKKSDNIETIKFIFEDKSTPIFINKFIFANYKFPVEYSYQLPEDFSPSAISTVDLNKEKAKTALRDMKILKLESEVKELKMIVEELLLNKIVINLN